MFFSPQRKAGIKWIFQLKSFGQIRVPVVLQVLFAAKSWGGGALSDPHRKLQGIIGVKKNHILNALPGRIGSR